MFTCSFGRGGEIGSAPMRSGLSMLSSPASADTLAFGCFSFTGAASEPSNPLDRDLSSRSIDSIGSLDLDLESRSIESIGSLDLGWRSCDLGSLDLRSWSLGDLRSLGGLGATSTDLLLTSDWLVGRTLSSKRAKSSKS